MSFNRPFRLTRFFVYSSLATTLAVAVATAIISAGAVRNDLLEEAKDQAVLVIEHIQKDIRTRFLQPLL